MQFWRLVKTDDSASSVFAVSSHPLWERFTESNHKELCDKLGFTNDLGDDENSTMRIEGKVIKKNVDINTNSFILKMLYGIFLQGYEVYFDAITNNTGGKSHDVSPYNKLNGLSLNDIMSQGNKLLQESLSLNSLSYLLELFHHSCGNGHNANEDHTNTLYATILFEFLNMFIALVTNVDSLNEIDAVVSLLEIVLSIQPELSVNFWNSWKKSLNMLESMETFTNQRINILQEIKYPLFQLVYTLLEKTPHQPVYLLKLLNSLTVSYEAANMVLSMLSEIAVKTLSTSLCSSELEFLIESKSQPNAEFVNFYQFTEYLSDVTMLHLKAGEFDVQVS